MTAAIGTGVVVYKWWKGRKQDTDHNVLLGAPTGSGKTLAAELAIFRIFNVYPGTKVRCTFCEFLNTRAQRHRKCEKYDDTTCGRSLE